MVIDFHAHIYPAKIAEKATKAIGDFYNTSMAFNGSIEELIASGDKIGVEKYIVHSTATKAAQVSSINDFIIGEIQKEPKFVGFGTVHPDFLEFEPEMKRIKNLGLKGIKLHPDFQHFQIDSETMDPIYEVLSSLNMPILVHAGDVRYDFSGPKRIANVLDKHPKLKVIAAHFGGYTEWDASFEYLAGREVWFDTSSTLWKLDIETAKKIMNKHGIEKFLFGSDFPMWDHLDEMKRFEKLGLTGEDRDLVLYKNAENLLASLG